VIILVITPKCKNAQEMEKFTKWGGQCIESTYLINQGKITGDEQCRTANQIRTLILWEKDIGKAPVPPLPKTLVANACFHRRLVKGKG
jgi:hypothetical protein